MNIRKGSKWTLLKVKVGAKVGCPSKSDQFWSKALSGPSTFIRKDRLVVEIWPVKILIAGPFSLTNHFTIFYWAVFFHPCQSLKTWPGQVDPFSQAASELDSWLHEQKNFSLGHILGRINRVLSNHRLNHHSLRFWKDFDAEFVPKSAKKHINWLHTGSKRAQFITGQIEIVDLFQTQKLPLTDNS